MRKNLILFFIIVLLPVLGHSESLQDDSCSVKEASRPVRQSIDGWFKDTEFDRQWHGRDALRTLLEDPDTNCRDVIELERAFYLLDLRDWQSSTGTESAEFILANPDNYDRKDLGKAVLFLLGAYKAEKRYVDLVSLSQKDVVKEFHYTLIPARDAFVLSSFALRGPDKTLEMLRPLANEPVNIKDWWLMHFSHALAVRAGDQPLADQFLEKADDLFVPKRPFEFSIQLEGDKADKMLALATYSSPDKENGWQIIAPPKPDYPRAALRKLESGACDVVFDISASGETENVRPYCTSKRFLKEAKRAIDDVRFESIFDNPSPASGVIYPLEFTIHG